MADPAVDKEIASNRSDGLAQNQPDETASPQSLSPQGIAQLLFFEERARDAETIEKICYRAAQDSADLLQAIQTIIVLDSGGRPSVKAVSGAEKVDAGSPYIQSVQRFVATCIQGGDDEQLNEEIVKDQIDEAVWPDDFGSRIYAVGLDFKGQRVGSLLIKREKDLGEAELRLLSRYLATVAHALLAKGIGARKQRTVRIRQFGIPAFIVALLAVLALVQVPLEIIAEAQIRPVDPVIVRSPLNAVVADILVEPNEQVVAGTPLVRLEDEELIAQLETARQRLEIARASYRQAQQLVLRDPDAASRLALLQSDVQLAQLEVAYVRDLLTKVEIKANEPGLVLAEDLRALIGKPVGVGERLMELADSGKVEVVAWIAPGDLIPLKEGQTGTLFLDSATSKPVDAVIERLDFLPTDTPLGGLGFRLVATPMKDPGLRIGASGSFRISGDKVSLGFYLFRRPWAAIRPWFGFFGSV